MIRPAQTEADLEVCVAVFNAVHPEAPITVEMLQRASGSFLLDDDKGYAYVDRSSVPGSAYAMVRVRPNARRGGIGSALLAAARTAAGSFGCESMWGRVGDDESLGFVTRRGFEELMREVNVALEVRPGDGEVAPGIEELRPEHLEGAYRVCAVCMPETSVPQRAEAPPFEDWVERVTRDTPAAFVALDQDGGVVGFASLHRTGTATRLEHGLTAVLPSHRRRGIGTALKRAQIAWAAGHGYRELVTEMVDGNAAMRAVNERLGYRPLPATVVVSGSAA
ncbi:MAG TPA: GNAT family N-acetyltransferase [Gaiellaceae bacterium]|nr:GNAT family N-acetyltransferase [Gaiellaceae bacterium]